MKKIFYGVLFINAILFGACNESNSSNEKHSHDGHQHKVSNKDIPVITAEFETDSLFQNHVDIMVHFYTHIQTALAGDDLEEASLRAKQLKNLMQENDTISYGDKGQELYSKYKTKVIELSNDIQTTDDIELQRERFENLSNIVYQLVKAAGSAEPLYKSYCPMAFDGKGAIWLSETEDIANPYYGASMYSCGSVQELVKR